VSDPLMTELERAIQELAKEMLGEAAVREQVRGIVRTRLTALLDNLAEVDDQEREAHEDKARKKKGK